MKQFNQIKNSEIANKIITELIKGISSFAPDLVTGIYLTGSVALNDFHPEKSDIDFVITCSRHPDKQDFTKLKKLHKQIQKQFPKPDLSGCYIAHDNLQTNGISPIPVLSWHEGSLRYQNLEMAPIVLYELKTTAITLAGIDAGKLEIRIGQQQVNDFMYGNINSYWKKWIEQHAGWHRKKILLFLFPRFTEWVVLGMARMYCTLITGNIVSKATAGNFCMERLPDEFLPVLQQAMQIRNDNRTYPIVRSYAVSPSLKRTKATIRFAEYLLAEFNKAYSLYNGLSTVLAATKPAGNATFQTIQLSTSKKTI